VTGSVEDPEAYQRLDDRNRVSDLNSEASAENETARDQATRDLGRGFTAAETDLKHASQLAEWGWLSA
jgi:hypothetical protein